MCSVRRNPLPHQFTLGQFQVSHPLLYLIWNLQSDGHNTVFLPLYFSSVNSLTRTLEISLVFDFFLSTKINLLRSLEIQIVSIFSSEGS